jgi:mannan endo-1,4-beta-mannosidase
VMNGIGSRHSLPPGFVKHLAAAGAIALALSLASACGASGHPAKTAATSAGPSKTSLLHPNRKYYGVFADGAPRSLGPLNSIKEETGKEPNLDVWYQAWNSNAATGTVNFDSGAAKQACAAGILPMLTWESWDTSVAGTTNPGVAYNQPAFAATKIIDGDYDAYIRNTANAIKAIDCPLAVRLDQEPNGYWYPWGLQTKGMGSSKDTPKRYIAMWRHVWTIFHDQHVNNVLWVWSPNIQGRPHKGVASLRASYPGNKYVDWVGIDGYYINEPQQTFAKLFGPTIKQIKSVASTKPWLIAETAVGTGPTKPKQITNLVTNVADRKEFNGFIYFDFYAKGVRSDWRFQQTAASLAAFKAAIANKTFGSGKPGTL